MNNDQEMPIASPDQSQPRGEDPRLGSEFCPDFYPLANGKPPPPVGASNRNDRIVLEFLAAYYEVNRRYSALLKTRSQPDGDLRQPEERERLQALEKALVWRDALEDRYAPFGVIAEAKVKQGFATSVEFTFGNVDAMGKPRSAVLTLAAHVSLPLSTGEAFEDWAAEIRPAWIIEPASTQGPPCGN